MSYGNWKHILFSIFNGIFVIKHTWRDPLSEQHTWSTAFDGLKSCFLLHFSFFFLSFLWSSLPSILFSFFWWSQALLFFLNHKTHLVFTAGGDGGDRCRFDRRYISSSFVQVRSSLHQCWVCVGSIIVVGIGGWRKKKKERKKKGMPSVAVGDGGDRHRGRERWEKFAGLHLLCSSRIQVWVFFFFPLPKLVWYFMRGRVRAEEWIKVKWGG